MSGQAPLGLYGGTFDPVHYGHLRAAAFLRESLGLAAVRLIPAAIPPHRGQPAVPAAQRLAMARLGIAEFPGLEVDDCELRRAETTGRPSYTVDTLAALRAEVGPARPLVLVLGPDAFASLTAWHRYTALFELAHVLLMTRPGWTVDDTAWPEPLRDAWQARHVRNVAQGLHSAPAGSIGLVDVPPNPISATAVRERLASGVSVSGLLPAAVIDYIDRHHLYSPQ